MKTRLILLIIVAVLAVLYPLVSLVQYTIGNHIMVNGVTVSGSIVLLISIGFSIISWFLFAWASKNIKVVGIPLSIISGAALMISFHGILGPMASVIVGLVAGFAAFMFQKYLTTRDKKSLIITIAIVAVSYLLLITMIVIVSNTLQVWNTGDGIGEWTGTADGMERQVHVVGPSFIVDNIPTGNPNECWYQDKNGQMVPCVMEHTIDLDPDLSPSYSYDWPGSTFYLNFYPLVIVPLVVAGLFLIPHFILKTKNIPSKPYMALILSGLLLHYGITSLISNVIHLSSRLFLIDKGVSNFIAPLYISFLIPIILLGIAGILLYRSSIIRKLIKR